MRDIVREYSLADDSLNAFGWLTKLNQAYAGERITAKAAILIAYYRGLWLHTCDYEGQPELSMMAVGLGYQDAQKICSSRKQLGRIFVAASNSPTSSTLTGERAALEEAFEDLQRKNIFARILRVDKAFHSPFMRGCAEPYLESLGESKILYRDMSTCLWVSSVHGFEMDYSSDPVNDNYWIKNLLQPVLFSESLSQIVSDHGPFDFALEVGPHSTLRAPFLDTLKALDASLIPYGSALQRNKSDLIAFGDCVCSIWATAGPTAVSLERFQSDVTEGNSARRTVVKDLPTYPWDHEIRYWRESRLSREYRLREQPHELLGYCSERSAHQMKWRNVLTVEELPWLQGHKFQGEVLFPAAGYCVMALEAARLMWVDYKIKMVELCDIEIHLGIPFANGGPAMDVRFSLDATANANHGSSTKPEYATAYFSCSAGKVDGSDDLLTRFTGSLHVTFGEVALDLLPLRNQEGPQLSPIDIGRFYKDMSSIGLDYADIFRNFLTASRASSFCSAVLSNHLSDFVISPGLLDSCLQSLFISFASPGDEYASFVD